MRRRSLPLFLLLVINSWIPAFSASYFVTQSGAGSHNGASLGNAWSVANYNASAAPTGGDTVFFLGTITSTVTPNTSGSTASLLTLDFSSATITPPGITFGGKNYIKMQGGCAITNSPPASNCGTFSGGTNGAKMIVCTSASTNITISGFTYAGASSGDDVFVSASGGCNNFTVSNNSISGIANCIELTGGHVDTWDIANNACISNSVITNSQTDMLFIPDATNITIEGNYIINQAPDRKSVV